MPQSSLTASWDYYCYSWPKSGRDEVECLDVFDEDAYPGERQKVRDPYEKSLGHCQSSSMQMMKEAAQDPSWARHGAFPAKPLSPS
jgi:hypothetical protein